LKFAKYLLTSGWLDWNIWTVYYPMLVGGRFIFPL